MTRLFETTALALVLALPALLASSAGAAAQQGQPPGRHAMMQPNQGQGGQATSQAGQQQAPSTITVAAASDIVGRTVRDQHGHDAGRVDELMINAVTGDVDYLIIGSDGAFNIGNKLIAVPWNQQLDPSLWGNDSLTLNTSVSRLEHAPRLDRSDLSKLVEPTEMAQIIDFYATPQGHSGSSQPEQQQGQNESPQQGQQAQNQQAQNQQGQNQQAQNQQRQQPQNGNQQAQNQMQQSQKGPQRQSAQASGSSQQPGQQASGGNEARLLVGRRIVETIVPVSLTQANTINDASVHLPNGQDVGRVDQVMIDTDQGRVAYLLVSRGETLGMGGQWVPVPIEALAWSPRNDSFVLRTSAQLQQIHGFPKQRLPSQVSTAQLDQLYESYGLSPNGELASAEEQGNGQQGAMRPGGMQGGEMPMGRMMGSMPMHNMQMGQMQMGQRNGIQGNGFIGPSNGGQSNGGQGQGYAQQYAMPNYPQRGPGMMANRGEGGYGMAPGGQGYGQQNGEAQGYGSRYPQQGQQYSNRQPPSPQGYGQPNGQAQGYGFHYPQQGQQGYGQQAYGQGQSYPPQGYRNEAQQQYGYGPRQPQHGQQPAYSGSSEPNGNSQGAYQGGPQSGPGQGMPGSSRQQ